MTERPGDSPPVRGKTGLILAGAGEARRMGGVDKVFTSLGGQPLVYWPLKAAHDSGLIDTIVLVLGPHNVERGRAVVRDSRFTRVEGAYVGGAERQDSVRIGLSRLTGCEWVLVHDAARPFLDSSLIEDGLAAARDTGAAIAAVKVKDTIKLARPDGYVEQTPLRERLWAAQTPQVFRFDIISEAYKSSGAATDDAALVERMGVQVKLYRGSYENIKVTTPEDLIYAEMILKRRAACAPE